MSATLWISTASWFGLAAEVFFFFFPILTSKLVKYHIIHESLLCEEKVTFKTQRIFIQVSWLNIWSYKYYVNVIIVLDVIHNITDSVTKILPQSLLDFVLYFVLLPSRSHWKRNIYHHVKCWSVKLNMMQLTKRSWNCPLRISGFWKSFNVVFRWQCTLQK